MLHILEQMIAIDRSGAEPVAGVLIETSASDAELGAGGAIVLGRVGEIVAARVPVSAIASLSGVAGVQRVEAARQVHALNNEARAASNAAASGEDLGLDGTGVVVGVIDTGIDIFHDDFRNPDGTTRIAALLDLTTGGAGTAYTADDINDELRVPNTVVPQRDTFGHGTHVAGSAAGDGSAANAQSAPAGTYAGMAPGATLVIVKAGEGGATTDAIVAGLDFIDEQAALLDMPWVTNISLGGQIGAHDGSRLDERAIDALVGAGQPGKAVVVAAGNDGWFDLHASGEVTEGTTEDLIADVPSGTGLTFIDIWYDGGDELGFGFVDPDGVAIPAAANEFAPGTSSEIWCRDFLWCVAVTHTLPDAASGSGHIEAILFNDARAATPGSTVLAGDWTFELFGEDIEDGRFDAWTPAGTEFLPPHLDGSMRIAMPGTARDAITVGAYVSRENFESQTGTSGFGVGELGDLAAFSGDGPTRDGRAKPDIAAPGAAVISSRSAAATHAASTLAPGGLHYGSAGTSMATPMVTGVIALLFEADPTLDAAEVRDLLTSNAVHDATTGSTPNSNWGSGRLNVLGAACDALGAAAPAACSSLTVTKVVVNDDGGVAAVDDFTLRVDGDEVESGAAVATAPGLRTVTEDGDATLAYVATFSGDCSAAGRVTVPANGEADCTVTNDDLPALLSPGVFWHLYPGTSEPPSDWTLAGFDDSAWDTGQGPIGYGVSGFGTELEGMRSAYSTAYLRGRFTIASTTRLDALVLEIRFADGFVAYLNGEEVARRNVTGSPTFDATADSALPASNRAYVALDGGDVVTGENVLAVHALNADIADAQFVVHPVLRAKTRTVTPPPSGGGGGGGGGGGTVMTPTPTPTPTPTVTPSAGAPPPTPVLELRGFAPQGVALWVLLGGATTSDLVARMAESGANANGCTVASLQAGRWVILIPGALDQRVNAAWNSAFPAGIPDGTPLWSRCR